MRSSHGAEGHGRRRCGGCASAPRRRCSAATTSSSSPTAWSGPTAIPIPALLATAAVHHHLIRKGLRTSVGLVVETGEAREVHHFACLAGYGAEAINPYLAFETLAAMAKDLPEAVERLRSWSSATSRRSTRACSRSCRRWASRPTSPIAARRSSTRSACRAPSSTSSSSAPPPRIEGAGLAEIAEETARRHADAFGDSPVLRSALEVGGEYAYRLRGEAHCWTPQTVSLLQHAVRGNAARQVRRLCGSCSTSRTSTC